MLVNKYIILFDTFPELLKNAGWRPIKDYPKYMINKNGDILNIMKNKKLIISSNGVYQLYNKIGKQYFNPKKLLVQVFPELFETKNEEWKIIANTDNRYEVSNLGNVRNNENKEPLKPAISSGYYKVVIRNNNRIFHKFIHRLVLEAFGSPRPSDMHTVNHMDMNKLNNNISNLEWATQSEQLKHAYANRYIKEEHKEYIDEEWVTVKDHPNHLISSYGRIMNVKNSIIRYGRKDYNGYINHSLNSRKYRAHILVAQHFIEKEDPTYNIVDHIDSNRTNNHFLNLRWCTQRQNVVFSCGVPVKRIDPTTGEFTIFDSYAAAYRSVTSNGIRGTSIKNAIIKKVIYKNYLWEHFVNN